MQRSCALYRECEGQSPIVSPFRCLRLYFLQPLDRQGAKAAAEQCFQRAPETVSTSLNTITPVQQAVEMQTRAVAVAQIPRGGLVTGTAIIPMVDHEFQGARVVVKHQSCDNCLSMKGLGGYCMGDDLPMPRIEMGKCD